MGLDMYLDEHIYYGGKWRGNKTHAEGHTLSVSGKFADDNNLKTDDIQELTREVGYWRKANQIHGWFVENAMKGNDDCSRTYVSVAELQKLHDTCVEVLQALDDKRWKRVEELLPPTEGFFFGEYDVKTEWYRSDIEYTIKVLSSILKEDKGHSYYYTASW